MKDGALLQVGSPDELYFRPDSVFVAGFIGSPSMNFIAGALRGTAEAMTFEEPNLRVDLPPDRARSIAEFAGSDVKLGIRPEDIHDPDFLPRNVRGTPVRARVDVTEMMGNEKFLHVFVGEHALLARVDPRTRARVGQEIELRLDVDRLHLFDAATDRAIGQMPLPQELEQPPAGSAAAP